MTEAKVNYNFEESEVSVNQIRVTNNLGRLAEHLEIVALDGFVGEVRNFDGIADGAVGIINVDDKRLIGTTQIETSDTFVVGGAVYFAPGGSAEAGKIRSSYVSGAIPLGVCTKFADGVSVEFRPFVQNVGGAAVVKVAVYDVDADASSGIVVTGLVPLGAKIVDVMAEATAAVATGTLTLQNNAGTPAGISSAVVCAVNNAVARTASLTNDVVTADGLRILGSAAGVRGIVTIFWR